MRVERTASGLLLPSHYRMHDERPTYRCIVCIERGEPGEFYDPLTYERHVNECADRHPETIRKMSPQQQAPSLFGDKGSDIEWRDWLQKHEREIAEGRMNDKTSDGKS